MTRPNQGEYNPYFQGYINQVPQGDFRNILNENTNSVKDFFQNIPAEKHEYRYAEGKWTLKEMLMHIIDTERIMTYRALTIARKDETKLPGFDENGYADNADVSGRTMDNLVAEFLAVRSATVFLFEHMSEENAIFLGNSNGAPTTPRALAYITIGHPLHHIKVAKERYF